ncbi:hypothetical protein OLZ90_003827 [Salmonella enterica]|nr:hypothetical protein [Salmonella enterica]
MVNLKNHITAVMIVISTHAHSDTTTTFNEYIDIANSSGQISPYKLTMKGSTYYTTTQSGLDTHILVTTDATLTPNADYDDGNLKTWGVLYGITHNGANIQPPWTHPSGCLSVRTNGYQQTYNRNFYSGSKYLTSVKTGPSTYKQSALVFTVTKSGDGQLCNNSVHIYAVPYLDTNNFKSQILYLERTPFFTDVDRPSSTGTLTAPTVVALEGKPGAYLYTEINIAKTSNTYSTVYLSDMEGTLRKKSAFEFTIGDDDKTVNGKTNCYITDNNGLISVMPGSVPENCSIAFSHTATLGTSFNIPLILTLQTE